MRTRMRPGGRYIVQCKEKHDDRHFVVLTEAELDAVCLKILTQRFNEKCWYYEPKEAPAQPTYSEQEAETLRGEAQVAAKREISQYKRRLRDWESAKEMWDRITKTIASKDGREAYHILNERSDYEYEKFELISSEVVPVASPVVFLFETYQHPALNREYRLAVVRKDDWEKNHKLPSGWSEADRTAINAIFSQLGVLQDLEMPSSGERIFKMPVINPPHVTGHLLACGWEQSAEFSDYVRQRATNG